MITKDLRREGKVEGLTGGMKGGKKERSMGGAEVAGRLSFQDSLQARAWLGASPQLPAPSGSTRPFTLKLFSPA